MAEYEEGSSLTFYTHQTSADPQRADSPIWSMGHTIRTRPLFIDGAGLKRLWGGQKRVFLLTFVTKQARLRVVIPQARYVLATYGDKLLISNHPD